MSEEKIKEIMNKLVNLFVGKNDARITKTDGTEVIIVGGSLSIFGDSITGRTSVGADVSILRVDIADAVVA
ncbi:MAG: hypothetical protein ACD_5C00340G0001 [uncultured bacterium]|nr:MAG: hypothetical protein ACD_5C00340G0001 [uncultured bacterium]